MTERTLFETLKTFALLLVAAFTFVPIYFMVVISFKDPVQFATQPFVPTWPIHLANYAIAWEYVGPYIGRTLFVVVTATFLTTLLGSLCAFYFAQFQFFGKEASFYYIIVLMMIPGILIKGYSQPGPHAITGLWSGLAAGRFIKPSSKSRMCFAAAVTWLGKMRMISILGLRSHSWRLSTK